ncbi:hypothetical protein A6F68_00194 [Tsuneonella dongtanensis]|uniref:Uncharacterized protein n=1 Tax=Tsuneonella dongtanensis TaxID=692370 RepID=A0A1B2A990_9SPHN|nr:hypothetical protein [Tsuneonella dongtanensis]ANY18729.1 hypothetical protein A6F68_00194 [Tsuneonella dongtanensis]
MRDKLALATALLAATTLSGCVAAALPVLAAGGIAKTRMDGDEPARNRPAVVLPAEPRPVEIASAPAQAQPLPGTLPATVREATFADGSTVTVINALPAARISGEAAAPVGRTSAQPVVPSGQAVAPKTDAPAASLPNAAGVRLTNLTELPPPSFAPVGGASGTTATAFAKFAVQQAAIPVVGGERRSAVLADSASMAPVTRDCSIHPAAVLVDLDPQTGTLDLSRPLPADRELVAGLAALRAADVVIGWTSSRTADQAGAVRKALQASGLDPAGRDQLVLLRFPEERKQTRRDDFAKAHCVVAIAGDARSDFDELFEYLREPAAAAPLESLIGAGWFLLPTPLTPN